MITRSTGNRSVTGSLPARDTHPCRPWERGHLAPRLATEHPASPITCRPWERGHLAPFLAIRPPALPITAGFRCLAILLSLSLASAQAADGAPARKIGAAQPVQTSTCNNVPAHPFDLILGRPSEIPTAPYSPARALGGAIGHD